MQLALNFLEQLASGPTDDYVILIPDVGTLADAPSRFPGLAFETVASSSALRRLIFERRALPSLYRRHGVTVVYTFFGPGLPHPKGITSVVSVAYPIICYPDSDYWRYVDRKTRFRQEVFNSARRRRLRSADIIVAETAVMQDRLAKALRKPVGDIRVMPPAPSEFVSPVADRRRPQVPLRVLVLSGSAPHKNVWRLPEVNDQLTREGIDVTWRLSMSQASFIGHLHEDGRRLVDEHGLEAYEFLGSVAPDAIQDCYAGSDALLSLSDLESFSNNYLEAWKTRTPLVVSDRDFAREICLDSAVYVEPHDPVSVAAGIRQLVSDPDDCRRRVEAGAQLLLTMPTAAEKRAQVLGLIDEVRSTAHR